MTEYEINLPDKVYIVKAYKWQVKNDGKIVLYDRNETMVAVIPPHALVINCSSQK